MSDAVFGDEIIKVKPYIITPTSKIMLIRMIDFACESRSFEMLSIILNQFILSPEMLLMSVSRRCSIWVISDHFIFILFFWFYAGKKEHI